VAWLTVTIVSELLNTCTVLIYQTARCDIPEDDNMNSHCREILEQYIIQSSLFLSVIGAVNTTTYCRLAVPSDSWFIAGSMPLGLASTVILGFGPGGTHDS
jgi:hypothetical protein